MKMALVGCHAGLHNKEQVTSKAKYSEDYMMSGVHTLFGAELIRTIKLGTIYYLH